jgi:hypothetical protein
MYQLIIYLWITIKNCKLFSNFVKFEDLANVTGKNIVFSDMTPYNPVELYQYIGGRLLSPSLEIAAAFSSQTRHCLPQCHSTCDLRKLVVLHSLDGHAEFFRTKKTAFVIYAGTR